MFYAKDAIEMKFMKNFTNLSVQRKQFESKLMMFILRAILGPYT